jgi:hypothetical protein
MSRLPRRKQERAAKDGSAVLRRCFTRPLSARLLLALPAAVPDEPGCDETGANEDESDNDGRYELVHDLISHQRRSPRVRCAPICRKAPITSQTSGANPAGVPGICPATTGVTSPTTTNPTATLLSAVANSFSRSFLFSSGVNDVLLASEVWTLVRGESRGLQ